MLVEGLRVSRIIWREQEREREEGKREVGMLLERLRVDRILRRQRDRDRQSEREREKRWATLSSSTSEEPVLSPRAFRKVNTCE